MRARLWVLLAMLLGFASLAARSGQRSEPTNVRLAVGGKPALFYLPLTVTERLGYFKNEGLDVEISDFAGGGRALQALIGGSADVVTGSFDHTIQMQAKNQPVTAVVQLGRLPGYVLGAGRTEGRVLARSSGSQGHEDRHHGARLQHPFHGAAPDGAAQLKPDDASFIGVGAGPSAIAAARRGEIDALVNVDPVIAVLESEGRIRIVADTRTVEGTREVFGGPYPAAVLYVTAAFVEKNPAPCRRSRTPSCAASSGSPVSHRRRSPA